MEQNQEVMNASGEAQCNGDAPQDKTFQERLSEIPLYTMTLNQLCSMYSSLKERNEVLNKALSAGEYYAKTIADTAKPVVASATTSALAAAKPVIGEVTDPGLYNLIRLFSLFQNFIVLFISVPMGEVPAVIKYLY